ncbi:MAG: SUF system NifU family Fe-S cluster assembly protein [Acidibacillus sp.]|uniref:Zinc-dependent sulfurtransferase SufU n=1 Tax=Sulfoacidibacillus ferrooxidans TaxID=2005001 RepID=A0A9X2AE73_9BACL|nr:SUF system NifU family Fe-S cluster assembly protein [Sulfoacidibacillus ferrooxidans]MCI0182846.1 Zinc-dependent sulfurtransferase SufU [Sulfoacidibacillus ferrooxidans]MCY0893254.1 SUF system NifU family Fe-S cluster assembly protein [Acidibacillus sp.]
MQLDDLYRQVIMDHYQHPRNQGRIEGDALSIDMKNPTCGDEITLQLQIEDNIVKDVRFKGVGCSISMASASMMTEAIKGKTVEEALILSEEFRKMMKGEEVDDEELGDLESLAGVSKFPARIKCATLAWHAFERSAK